MLEDGKVHDQVMSAKKEQDEPTMEEILASIRRIISEEGEPERAEAPAAERPAPRPRPVVVEPEPEPEDVLELTEVVDDLADDDIADDDIDALSFDEPAPVEVAAADDISLDEALEEDFETEFAAVEPEPRPEPLQEPRPEPQPAPRAPEPADFAAGADDDLLDLDAVDPADEADRIMSEFSADQVRASFGQLSDLIVAGYAGADKTLEGMVREMLKPMLKAWLDQNLPQIVERTVAREIARLARVKKP